jgi:hypothetical protein
MKKLTLSTLAMGALFSCALQATAQITVTVDPTTMNNGYMSWSPAVGDAAGYGGSGGGGWGFADLQASYSGTTLTLNPNINAYDDNLTSGPGGTPNAYWINADGSGANIMDANSYVDTSAGALGVAGGTLTFNFTVLANTLPAGYTADAWIKEFTSSYGFVGESTTVPLTVGAHSVTDSITSNASDRVQYGFELIGPDALGGSAAALDSVVIAPTAVPEPAAWTWAGSGSLLLLGLLRRRNK